MFISFTFTPNPKMDLCFQATAKNKKIRRAQLILLNDRWISIFPQKVVSISGSFVDQNSLCTEKSFKNGFENVESV